MEVSSQSCLPKQDVSASDVTDRFNKPRTRGRKYSVLMPAVWHGGTRTPKRYNGERTIHSAANNAG